MRPSQTIPVCLALSGYVVALIAGIAAGNPALRVLLVGLIVMIPAYVLGSLLGAMADHIVSEFKVNYERANPPAELGEVAGGAGDVDIVDEV